MKTILKSICIFIFVSLIPGCSILSQNSNTVADRIKTVLPDGWSIFENKNGLWIIKDEPVKVIGLLEAIGGSKKATARKFEITLLKMNYMSPSDFAMENRKSKELEKLRKKAMKIPHKYQKEKAPWNREFYPRTDEERQIVAQYRIQAPKGKLLPNLYLDNKSFYFGMGSVMYEFEDKSEEKECFEVLQSVLSLFKEYKKESNKENATNGVPPLQI